MRDDRGTWRIEKRAPNPEEEMGEEELVVHLAERQTEQGGGAYDGPGDNDGSSTVSVEPPAGEDGEEEDGEAGE